MCVFLMLFRIVTRFRLTTYIVLISRIDFVVLQHNDFPSIERDFTTFTIKRPSEEVRRKENKSWYMDWNSLWKCKKILCRDIVNIYSIQDSFRIYGKIHPILGIWWHTINVMPTYEIKMLRYIKPFPFCCLENVLLCEENFAISYQIYKCCSLLESCCFAFLTE